MSVRTNRGVAVGAITALALGGFVLPAGQASADWLYTPISQDQMEIVDTNSAEDTGEGANGAAELVLDGDADTYWHTEWDPTVIDPPHHLSVDLGATSEVGRVRLLPRQSSNDSGRVHEYELYAATGDCSTATFESLVAEGAFPGDVAGNAIERTITLDEPVTADCLKIVYLSTWGGHVAGEDTSRVERVGSLAELNVDTATWDDGEPTDPGEAQPIEVVVPEGAVEITDGDLSVRLHPDFPQVVDYRLGGEQLAGRVGDALNSVRVNEEEQAVEVAAPVVDGATATYAITFPEIEGVSLNAVASVTDGTFRLELADLVDAEHVVQRIRIPGHDLVTVGSADAAAQLTAGRMGVDRNRNDDFFQNIADTAAGGVQPGGGYTYEWVTKWVFNNMVLFR